MFSGAAEPEVVTLHTPVTLGATATGMCRVCCPTKAKAFWDRSRKNGRQLGDTEEPVRGRCSFQFR